MNERIRELMIQSNPHGDFKDCEWVFEKFAELIVEECANVADENYIHRGSRTCGLAIRLHFGVNN
jgi:hypothetical protein